MVRAKTRRGLVALGVSLGVHLCVFAFVRPDTAPRRALPSPPVQQPRLTWIDVVPAEEPRAGGTGKQAPPTTPKPGRAKPPKKVQAGGTPTAAPPPGTDSPLAIQLAPSGTLVLPSDGAGGESPRGVTLHPGDLPGADELLADEQERVAGRVGGWMKQGLASARVRGGLPDPSYGELGRQLRAATDDVPRFIDTNSPKEVVGALLESWGAGAERYGKTGAPYAEPEGRLESLERPSELATAAAKGSPDALALASFLSAGARLQEFADGRAGVELYALVEIRQQPSGTLESVELIRPSGLRPFDAWVTERAKEVSVSFTFDAGTRATPLRSVWRFDGVIKYRRKLDAKHLDGRAVVGMMTMAALSALSSVGNVQKAQPGQPGPDRDLGPRMPAFVGRFDELTGEMDMVDLTNPTYDCTVRLIEAD